MKSKAEILEEFSLFSIPTGGIGSWLTEQTHADIFERLGKLDEEPLPAVQVNQLLVLGHEAPVGDGFFRYYWLQAPEQHPYSVREVPGFSEDWLQSEGMIASLAHLTLLTDARSTELGSTGQIDQHLATATAQGQRNRLAFFRGRTLSRWFPKIGLRRPGMC